MGELPKERVEPVPPFTSTRIDCFGPFKVNDRCSEVKRWGVLFTCLYSRAVHIEVIEDVSTDTFIGAVHCFMDIRGPVSILMRNNGTNFVEARNELKRQFQDLCNDKQIKFKIISPTASHQGGVWERQIRPILSVFNEILSHCGRFDTHVENCVLRGHEHSKF